MKFDWVVEQLLVGQKIRQASWAPTAHIKIYIGFLFLFFEEKPLFRWSPTEDSLKASDWEFYDAS